MNNTHTKKILVTAISATLVGCGGGGGGGGGTIPTPATPVSPTPVTPVSPTPTTPVGNDVPFSTPVKIDEINPLVTSTYNYGIVDTFKADLTNTGADNIVIAGRMSVSNATWKNSLLNVYGWNNNVFENQTSQWFSGNDNEIIGTEPSVQFADFNGDSFLDMYVAPGTDQEAVDAGPGAVFINNSGTSFTRSNLDLGDTWSHGSAVADLNNDGNADIITLDYGNDSSLSFGNGDGSFTVVRTGDYAFSGSSVVAGDFLGNGTTTMVLTDTGANGSVSDTELWGYTDNGNGTVTMNKIATLPTPILDTGDYSDGWTGTGSYSHDIRSLAMDFNNDGALDVIVISRPANGGTGTWGGGSMVQFLANDGSGNFTDVSESTVVGYDYSKTAAYNPQVLDLNNDGLNDILLSGAGVGNTQVLVQTSEGKFVASYETVMDAFQNQVKTDMGTGDGGWDDADSSSVNIIRGPDGNLYLVTAVAVASSIAKKAVYISKIEASGVTTAPATIAAVQQLWPYLSDAEANEVLAQTSTTWYGMNLLEFENILNPVGSLNLALDGREGLVMPISGYINGVNLSGKLDSVIAVDELRRHFTVNLSSTALDSTNFWASNFETQDSNSTGGTQMIGNAYVYKDYVMSFNEDTQEMSVGFRGVPITDTLSFGAQFTNVDYSPWVNFTGMWGEVKGSHTTEVTVQHKLNGFVTRLGVMNTSTDYTAGLVTDVSDIVSAWGETGYATSTWAVHAGFLPTVIDGHVNIKMPYGIDYTGKILYNNVEADVVSDTISYARASYATTLTENKDYVVNFDTNAIAASDGYRKVAVNFSAKF